MSEGMFSVDVAISTVDPVIVHVHERGLFSFHVHDPGEGDSARGIYRGARCRAPCDRCCPGRPSRSATVVELREGGRIDEGGHSGGGMGTRISEETQVRPKPMVEIGGRPILWHIMKIYAHHGVREFIVCLGYKGYVIKEYFANYFIHNSDVTFHLADNRIDVHQRKAEPWQVTLVDTGRRHADGRTTQAGAELRR